MGSRNFRQQAKPELVTWLWSHCKAWVWVASGLLAHPSSTTSCVTLAVMCLPYDWVSSPVPWDSSTCKDLHIERPSIRTASVKICRCHMESHLRPTHKGIHLSWSVRPGWWGAKAWPWWKLRAKVSLKCRGVLSEQEVRPLHPSALLLTWACRVHESAPASTSAIGSLCLLVIFAHLSFSCIVTIFHCAVLQV